MTHRRLRQAAFALAIHLLSSAAIAAQQAPPPAGDNLQIRFEAGLLTLNARDVTLAELLYAIGDEAGFEVTIERELEAAVSVSFTRLPLQQGLKRLLDKNSYLIYFDASKNVSALQVLEASTTDGGTSDQPTVTTAEETTGADLEVWILDRLASPRQDDRIVAVRRLAELGANAAVNLASSILQSEVSPVVRAETVTALGKIGGEEVHALLDLAMMDADVAVRRHAIGAWQALGGEASVQALGRALSEEADDATRILALQALGSIDSETARYYIELARSDGNETIRKIAGQLLEGDSAAIDQADGVINDALPEVTQ